MFPLENRMTAPTLVIQTDDVDAFEPQVQRLLWALLGHGDALVTDLADVGDFMPWPGKPEPTLLEAVAQLVQRPVTVNDRLVDLARELATLEAAANASRH